MLKLITLFLLSCFLMSVVVVAENYGEHFIAYVCGFIALGSAYLPVRMAKNLAKKDWENNMKQIEDTNRWENMNQVDSLFSDSVGHRPQI